MSYLIENNQFQEARDIVKEIDYINTTLLLSQAKSWMETNEFERFDNVFSCKNYNDLISEFLFLISNLYSSQEDFDRSNYYLNLSIF